MEYTEIVNALQTKKYVKEVKVDNNQKLLFYYNNKAKAEDGGVFIYRVDKSVDRPERKTNLHNYFAEARTSAFNGVANYTSDVHRTLFDTKNKLF